MVNCKNCGAPLSLDQAYCPHCGTPNPEAQEHLKKLSQLDKDFKLAKEEVKEEVQKSKRGYGVLVILVMLLIANLIMFLMHGASYEISEKIIASRMSHSEIKATLDDLIEKGEYIEMNVFMEKYYLPYNEYGDYSNLSYLAGYFSDVIEQVSLYYHANDPYSDPLMRSSQRIKEFEEEYERVLRRDEGQFKEHIETLHEQFVQYLKTYLFLTDEDIDSISELSDSQLLVLISRRLNHEEE